jgi:hypothetical protein
VEVYPAATLEDLNAEDIDDYNQEDEYPYSICNSPSYNLTHTDNAIYNFNQILKNQRVMTDPVEVIDKL